MADFTHLLAEKTKIEEKYVRNILQLLQQGATVPFIARYRKEQTGTVSDGELREFMEEYEYLKRLQQRKEEIKALLEEKEQLSKNILNKIINAKNLNELEDLYKPFKESKTTKATAALKAGLAPLARMLEQADMETTQLQKAAKGFLKGEIKTVSQALEGAKHIIAQKLSEDAKEREIIRKVMFKHGILEVKAGKEYDSEGVYSPYINYKERVLTIPSHRYLAIARGEKQKQLSVKITIDRERVLNNIVHHRIPPRAKSAKRYLEEAYKDGFTRLMLPSVERQVHALLKERSQNQAALLFGKNVAQMLMTPPVRKQTVLGVDPGFKSGCKLAVLDPNGELQEHGVIFPTPPKNDFEGAKAVLERLVHKHGIKAAAIGNGTASRETQEFFARFNDQGGELAYTVVSEAGASVYSASKEAAREYPELDVTVRGAISIAARLQDPMAALVKIDPKSLGVGQYQHDIDKKLLDKRLEEAIEDVVNRVGVDLNSASAKLLSYVSGIGPKLAETIVKHRREKGGFATKRALLEVKGFGEKAFEQAAGFLRIKEGNDPLDNTGIHPESYGIAKRLQKKKSLENISREQLQQLCQKYECGCETLRDIIFELQKPGFDPRSQLPAIPFKKGVTTLEKLKVGEYVSGVVRNITDFGAFVDIGLKNDALIHISKLSAKQIRHPFEAVAVGQYLPSLEVIEIERKKQRVSLRLND